MAISIAGRQVVIGDTLYHTGFRTWGTVIGYDTNSAVLEIIGQNDSRRKFFVSNGGMIGAVRQVYWHEPLVLDRPYQDVTALQNVVDALVLEFNL